MWYSYYEICLVGKNRCSVNPGLHMGCFRFFAMEYQMNIKEGKPLDLNIPL